MDNDDKGKDVETKREPTFREKGRPTDDRQNTLWWDEIRGKCEHDWKPLSFVFECQLLDKDGRVQIRQPGISKGRVYCVCMKCLSHSYVETAWAGYYLGSPDLLEDALIDNEEPEVQGCGPDPTPEDKEIQVTVIKGTVKACPRYVYVQDGHFIKIPEEAIEEYLGDQVEITIRKVE